MFRPVEALNCGVSGRTPWAQANETASRYGAKRFTQVPLSACPVYKGLQSYNTERGKFMKLVTPMLLTCVAAITAVAANIPSGTEVIVRLGQTIRSDKVKPGENWVGTLAADLVVNGRIVAKKNADVRGRIVDAKASGRLSGVAEIALQLSSITIDGTPTPVLTQSVSEVGGNHNKRNAGLIGGGAAVGAIIGGIAGGGQGAAIGAGAGAAAGTGGAAATGKKNVTFPAESILTFVVR